MLAMLRWLLLESLAVVLILLGTYLCDISWYNIGYQRAQPPPLSLPLYYTPPATSGINTTGKQFNVDVQLLRDLDLPPRDFFILNNETVRDFVFVTACSHDHVIESMDAIGSIQRHFPGYPIHYYDIGLTEEDRVKIGTWCNVTLHNFPFERYPKHVLKVKNKSFKYLVIQDALRLYGAVFWVDASFRALNDVSQWEDVFSLALANGGLVTAHNQTYKHRPLTNYAFTDPTMWEYLPTDQERQQNVVQKPSNTVLIYNTNETFHNVLWWMYLCSLEAHCCPPTLPKTYLNWQEFNDTTLRTTFIVHRYDQSALNTILTNLHGYNISRFAPQKDHEDVLRHPTKQYTLQTC